MEYKLSHSKPWWRFWSTREEKDLKMYRAGYEYAAASLLSGENTIDDIHFLVEYSEDFGDYSPFDEGMETSVGDYRILKQVAKW